ncbi:hypothetical protein [Deinococcus yunweiensis]|uniref:hypothetical protein n=1 Tax=Deinococcus yunweiensis TaxID=367282 RepID=UPI00398EE010
MTSVVSRCIPGRPSLPIPAGLEVLHLALETLPLDPVIRERLRGARSINDALRQVLDLRPELELLPLEVLAQTLRRCPELVPVCRSL